MTRFYLFIFFISSFSLAQTKLIAHKSAGGNASNFVKSLENDHFLTNSNLGAAPYRQITTAQLDSVIFLSKNEAIMVTSEVCTINNLYQDTLLQKSIWKAGKDTVRNHPLFSQQHALDSIKKEVDEKYNFQNAIEETVFINYDNQRECPIDSLNQVDYPIQLSQASMTENGLLWSYLFAAAFSIVFGWITHRFIKN